MRLRLTLFTLLFVLLTVGAGPASAAPKRAVVLVSGTAATTPFTTPTSACRTGYSAGNTWAYLRDSLVARGFPVYTAPASMIGTPVVATDSLYDGPFGDCPHRRCLQFPLTHSMFVSAAIGTAPDTSLTGSPAVVAALTSTIAAAGTALSDRNRSGCPARP